MYAFARKFGFADEFVKNVKLDKDAKGWDRPTWEDVREINHGTWTIGYSGQSPERLKLHMKHMNTFNPRTLKAEGGPARATTSACRGRAGAPRAQAPGSPSLYDTTRHVMDGGGTFRARFGVEKDGESLLAGDGSASVGSDLAFGYPEFDHVLMKKLGWWDELSDEGRKPPPRARTGRPTSPAASSRVVMKNHGCMPFGNARARAVVWNFPDPVPKHREPLFSTRPALIDKYPTHEDKKAFWRPAHALQDGAAAVQGREQGLPLIMTSGRLVEYEGGGEETRSNPWLAELQQDMFVELNPKAAADRGINDRDWVWVKEAPPARRSRCARWSPRGSTTRPCSCPSTSRAAGWVRTCSISIRMARRPSCAARQSTPPPPTATTW